MRTKEMLNDVASSLMEIKFRSTLHNMIQHGVQTRSARCIQQERNGYCIQLVQRKSSKCQTMALNPNKLKANENCLVFRN